MSKEIEEKCPKCQGRVGLVLQQGKYMLVTGGPAYQVAVRARLYCTEISFDHCGWEGTSGVRDIIFEFGD